MCQLPGLLATHELIASQICYFWGFWFSGFHKSTQIFSLGVTWLPGTMSMDTGRWLRNHLFLPLEKSFDLSQQMELPLITFTIITITTHPETRSGILLSRDLILKYLWLNWWFYLGVSVLRKLARLRATLQRLLPLPTAMTWATDQRIQLQPWPRPTLRQEIAMAGSRIPTAEPLLRPHLTNTTTITMEIAVIRKQTQECRNLIRTSQIHSVKI